jgi:hypothetical protein
MKRIENQKQKQTAFITNPQDLIRLLMELTGESEKIIVTTIHKGTFDHIHPKYETNPKKRAKIKTPFYKLGRVVVPEKAFEGEKDYGKGLLPVFPYSMITILWKSEKSKKSKIPTNLDSLIWRIYDLKRNKITYDDFEKYLCTIISELGKLRDIERVFEEKEYETKKNVQFQMLRDISNILHIDEMKERERKRIESMDRQIETEIEGLNTESNFQIKMRNEKQDEFIKKLEEKILRAIETCGKIMNPCTNQENFDCIAEIINFCIDFFLKKKEVKLNESKKSS